MPVPPSLPAIASRPAPTAAGVGAARYRHAFIVTYGRSGSTLLQGVLNALPGYLIRGENWDLLGHMHALYGELPRHRERQTGPNPRLRTTTPQMPHYGFERFRNETYLLALRRFFDTMLVDDPADPALRCLGFKEIHYTPEDVSDKVDFLRAIYPGCALVYNIRNPESVAASEFQKGRGAAYFERFNNVLRDLAGVDPNAFLVRYEDVVAGANTLPALLAFLGEAFDAQAHAAVVGKKHSYHTIKPGRVYSSLPATVRMAPDLQGLDLFVAERLQVRGPAHRLDGFIMERPGTTPRRFARLVDSRGRSVPFAADYELPSPKVATKLANPAAARARFTVRFRRLRPEPLQLYFADGMLALTFTQPAGPAAAPGPAGAGDDL